MSNRKKFEIVRDVRQNEPSQNITRGKRFQPIGSPTFVALNKLTPSGKMTITNESRPRKCPLCQTEGAITYSENNKCICKKCGYNF
jgi:hypothetical protein